MHSILELPELLSLIFTHLDRASNVANALVCKRWSQVALDRIWYDMNSLTPLLRILAPLVRDRSPGSYGNHMQVRAGPRRRLVHICINER